ncbi:MAG: GTP-binding protein, partial [archaeon]
EIREIEEELAKTKYNKATQHHIGRQKAKLARLKEQLSKSGGIGKSQGLGYGLKKTGDATVILVGFPSVGKSTLLNQLTNADSPIGAYDFTTLEVVPGMMDYHHAKIQIFDVPGLVSGAAEGKGRGKEVLSVIRNADLVILLIDATKAGQLEKMEKELYEANFRLDQGSPSVKIKKQMYGGVVIDKSSSVKLDNQSIKDVLTEFGFLNVHVSIRGNPSFDDFLDAVIGNRKYVPSIRVLNKIDAVPELPKIRHDIAISADAGTNIDKLRKLIFKKLNFIRIFMKKQGKKADLEEPLIIREGATVEDVCKQLHNSFLKRFRYAEIWGPSAKFDSQKVHLKHVVKDGDVLGLILEKE